MFGPVRGRWKDGCRCGLRGWPPDGGAQRVFRERAAVECRAPAAEADVRHLRGGGCRVADRGLGPVCSWSRQGVGMSGVGRCAADRRCRVVGQQGGCRAGAGRCGPLGAARAGVDSLFRRGRHGAAAVSERGRSHPPDGAPVPAWSLSSGGPGIGSVRTVGSDEGRRGPSVQAGPVASPYESLPFPDGPVASPGRKASHLRAQRPPEGARCSVFGLFLSFSAASRRAGTDAVCKSAVSPLGKSEKVVFLFLLYN